MTVRVAQPRPRVVVIGAGFAGLRVVEELAFLNCEVILLDRRNHHVFQPLLYKVYRSGLELLYSNPNVSNFRQKVGPIQQ